MRATLLSGLDAQTMGTGNDRPAPVLLRVNDLAFLTNQVRANLKGCFIIAEGEGRLSDERVHLRLVNLACLSKRGTAVIDQKIKGFVVDSDGRIGLRGEVISKFGALVGRSLMAGLLGGAGQAVRSQSQALSTSALGTTGVVDPSKIGQMAAGEGIATAATEIQKFYLELAKQAMPVIEVGSVRNVTIVISEGSDLKIREISGEGVTFPPETDPF